MGSEIRPYFDPGLQEKDAMAGLLTTSYWKYTDNIGMMRRQEPGKEGMKPVILL